jgi:hypothetical protein
VVLQSSGCCGAPVRVPFGRCRDLLAIEKKKFDASDTYYLPSDALYDAAMIMSGMGPVHHPAGSWGKLFASLFAVYSGLLLAVVTGILLAPLLHRVLHHMHLEGFASSKPRKKSHSV